jgi:mannose-1-phosphate guanylyltransferase
MILCAGLGMRMRPLTDELAKPLLPVGDRPALAHVLARVRALGGPIAVNAHHRAGDVRDFAAREGIAVSEEAVLLGTAGGLAGAGALLGEGDVLVWNGDILIELDAVDLVGRHTASGALATLAVAPRAKGEGNVGIDAGGRIVRLRGETTGAGEARGGDFVGVHVVGRALRGALPPSGCLVGDVYLPALRRGARLVAVDAPAAFFDIGSPAQYLAANAAWLGERASWVGDGAIVPDGVRLERSVVGRGAGVIGHGALARCVVWPGAVAEAPLADAIVSARGIVRVCF